MALYYYNKFTVAKNGSFSWNQYGTGQLTTTTGFNSSVALVVTEQNLGAPYFVGSGFLSSGTSFSAGTSFYYVHPGGYKAERYTTTVGGTVGQSGGVDCIFYESYASNGYVSEGAGSLVQSSILAENGTYPANGKHTDGYWYIRGSAYVPPNNAPSVPPSITASGEFATGKPVTFTWGASSDPEGSSLSYLGEYQLYKNGVAQGWVQHTNYNTTRSTVFAIPSDTTINAIEFRVRAFDGVNYSSNRVSTKYTISNNKVPTITLNTTDNRTLFENDLLSIDGTTTDTDTGNVITVRYSLNGVTDKAIATAISAGVAIPFSKVLQVKNSKLMDDETVLLDNHIEGQANTLRVWVTDDKGGVSTEQVRTFFVTPNRPPSLTIDSFTQKVGLINSDYITITGSVVDPEGGNVVVKYQIGEVNPVQVHDGPGGKFTFDIPLANLIDGENSIILLATDSLNFTSQKTLKVTKAVNKTELLQSVRRYKALPPKGSAKNVIIWVQRDINLSLSAEASMVMQNEAENFVEMTKTNSAPVTDTIMEDEFTISSDVPKDDIVFQFNMTRSSIDSTESIHLISGGFE